MKTIDKIITKVDCSRGAPMGRSNVGERPENKIIFDCLVPMSDSCYDVGSVYWGSPGRGLRLRVKYTKDLTYVEFYWSTRKKTWEEMNND